MAERQMFFARLTIYALLLLLFASAYIVALDFPERSARYPLVICAIGALLATANIVLEMIRGPRAAPPGSEDGPLTRSAVMILSATALSVPVVGLLGLVVGSALWLPLFLRYFAGMRWSFAILDGLAVAVLLYGLEWLGIGFMPPGLLLDL